MPAQRTAFDPLPRLVIPPHPQLSHACEAVALSRTHNRPAGARDGAITPPPPRFPIMVGVIFFTSEQNFGVEIGRGMHLFIDTTNFSPET